MAHRDEYTAQQERVIAMALEKKILNEELARRDRLEAEKQMVAYYEEVAR